MSDGNDDFVHEILGVLVGEEVMRSISPDDAVRLVHASAMANRSSITKALADLAAKMVAARAASDAQHGVQMPESVAGTMKGLLFQFSISVWQLLSVVQTNPLADALVDLIEELLGKDEEGNPRPIPEKLEDVGMERFPPHVRQAILTGMRAMAQFSKEQSQVLAFLDAMSAMPEGKGRANGTGPNNSGTAAKA